MKFHPLAVAIVATLLLGAVKLVVATLTGSRAVLASAADSLGDAVVSGVNLLMVRAAAEPPDEGHPWGHGKAEALASLTQAVLLAAVVAGVAGTAIASLWRGDATLPAAGPAMWGMALSMAGSFGISTYLARAARRSGSLVVGADAAHYRMDLLTGGAVLLGLAVTALTGRPEADAVASLAVSLWMTREVWALGKEAVDELMDRPLPESEVHALEQVLREVGEPVLAWHDLRTRRAGPFRFVQVHIELPATLSFPGAHAVSHRVEEALAGVLPNTDVIVHLDVEGEEQGRIPSSAGARSGETRARET